MDLFEVESWGKASLDRGCACKIITPNGKELLGVVALGSGKLSGELQIPLDGSKGTLGYLLADFNREVIGENLNSDQACEQMGLKFNAKYNKGSGVNFRCTSSGGSPDRNGVSNSICIYDLAEMGRSWWDNEEQVAIAIIQAVGVLAITPVQIGD